MDQGKEICLSKVRYKNRKMADRAAEYFQKSLGGTNRVYKCLYGKHFHLSSRTNFRVKKKKKTI